MRNVNVLYHTSVLPIIDVALVEISFETQVDTRLVK